MSIKIFFEKLLRHITEPYFVFLYLILASNFSLTDYLLPVTMYIIVFVTVIPLVIENLYKIFQRKSPEMAKQLVTIIVAMGIFFSMFYLKDFIRKDLKLTMIFFSIQFAFSLFFLFKYDLQGIFLSVSALTYFLFKAFIFQIDLFYPILLLISIIAFLMKFEIDKTGEMKLPAITFFASLVTAIISFSALYLSFG